MFVYVLLFCLFKGTTETQNTVALHFHLPKPKYAVFLHINIICGSTSPCYLSLPQIRGGLHPGCEAGAKVCLTQAAETGLAPDTALLRSLHHPCSALLCATAKFLPL